MASNGLQQQQTLNLGSPKRPQRDEDGVERLLFDSPKRPRDEDGVERLLFDSPKRPQRDEDGVERLLFDSPKRPQRDEDGVERLLFDSPKRPQRDENSSKSEVVMTPTCFSVNLGSPVPQIEQFAIPFGEFLSSLASPKANVLSPSSVPEPKYVGEKLGSGSYATVFKLNDQTVRKVYALGKKKGMVNTKLFWKHLSAFSRSHGNPQFARIDEITIVETEDGLQMHVEQEKCSPLTQENVIGYIRCIISILDLYLPFGQGEVSPKDVKRFNFGLGADGKVRCIDVDFTKFVFGEVPEVVSSGEFEHGDHMMFMSFVLTILDFFETTRSDFRKDDFKVLNYTSGILKKWGLLSSDRSVSEIDVDNFREILGSIKPSNGEEPLSDDEINRLVWFLTPESQ
jgi:hypothetical protein